MAYNPFLRTGEHGLQKAVEVNDEETDPWKRKVDALRNLRKMKDKFAQEQAQELIETETSS